MTAEILLRWMTHVGSGRWAAFRSRVAELSGETDDGLRTLCRRLRIGLSDLGHVDFFVDGTRRWRVRQPVLAGLSSDRSAIFTGGRVPRLVSSLHGAVEATPSCKLSVAPPSDSSHVERILVEGEPDALVEVAEVVGIRFIPDAAFCLAMAEPRMEARVAAAPRSPEPINWEVHSWSFDQVAWIPGRLRKTARMYVNRHGMRRHLAELGQKGLVSLDRREAVYAAAWRAQHDLAHYDAATGTLRTPTASPLPEGLSRAACLAAGTVASVAQRHLHYHSIAPLLGWMILDKLGQPSANRMVADG